MDIIKKVACSFLYLFISYTSFTQAQVFGVSYYMEYDTSECRYDCSVIVIEGSATFIPFRTQFNSQYTLVVPTGTTIAIEETYLPLQDNQYYLGTVPSDWTIGASAFNVLDLGIDYHPVSPNLGIASQYNDINEGDTLKIFSFSVTGNSECGTGVRFFENGLDQNVNGGDYSCGFTIGGPWEDYTGIEPIVYPPSPTIPMPSIDNTNGISIDLSLGNPASCQSAYSTSWTGPNNYMSGSEDVIINPAGPVDYGLFKVVVEDDIECKDSLEIIVSEPDDSVVDGLTLGNIIYTSTFEHIAIHTNIEGDDNKNSTITIEYRLTGTEDYLLGAIAMRASPEMIVGESALGMNFHAGSAMHLLPNSSYDLRLTIADADGGSQVIEETVSTKKFPSANDSEQIKYVVPGNGEGDGSIANPYKGLQTAADNLQPGDILEVGDGVYGEFSLTTSGTESEPIVIRATNLHGAVVNGNNTVSGVVTLGTASDSLQHIILDGFEIKNGAWGIDAQNTQYIAVRNNKINDVDFGFYNRRENGWEHDQYLNNNEIIGRTLWPQLDGNIPSERGIDIRGNANVISNNSISDFGDGISTDGPASQNSYALDIHNNYITRVVDDIIEVDGTISNTRVYRNKGLNGRMGISVSPTFGGAVYIFRNELYNLETSAFKMNNQTAGLVILNNSIAKSDRGLTSSEGWQNTIFKNNVVLSGHYVFEEFGLVNGSIDDWGNNAYLSIRAGTTAEPWFKWDGVKYNTMADIVNSGLTEINSFETTYSDFVSVVIPANYDTEALISDFNFMPSMNSNLVDVGVLFENIFVNDIEGIMLDVGAIEQGKPSPSYGHDFGIVCERNDMSSRIWNGNISIGWYHPSNWTPCGVPEKITDVTIPGALVKYPFVNSDIFAKNAYVVGNGQLEITNDIIFILTGNQ
ncbi:MAG: hypothetical protein ACI86M_001566 [Saprospiraceae bacterium]|jgi:hypothetical protein